MKKFILIVVLSISVTLWGETEFSGTAEINSMGILPLDKIILTPSIVFRVDAWDEKTNFESMFKAANSDDSESVTFDVLRLFIDYFFLDNLTISMGRKPFLMGYGYGWNPVDNINSKKDPSNPDSELKGIDSVSIQWNLLNLLDVRILSAIDYTDFDDLSVAGDISLILNGVEFLATGVYGDVNSVGLAVKKDILGAGLYGEGIVLFHDDYKFNYLIGLEYLFPTDTFVIAEYFYNDMGYDRDERLSLSLLSIEEFPLIYSSYYTKQYLLINITQSLYDINTTIGLGAIYSIDSKTLTIAPSMDIDISENMNINISYFGIQDFVDNDFTEADMSPIKQGIGLTFKYSF